MSFQLVMTCPNAAAPGKSTPEPQVVTTDGARGDLSAIIRQMAVYAQRDNNTDYRYYSYRIRELDGEQHHILCRCVLTGNKAETRLVHALILSPEEVAVLRNNAARPTPAGLILALENKLFWRTTLPDSPGSLNTEPTMTASSLPDAATQTVWKQLTGHKGNAKLLFTPPHDGGCILVLPPGTRHEDVLGLLHESDWLTPDRGWGRTFTTSGGANDRPGDPLRIAVPADSPLCTVPALRDLQIITIDKNLIPDEDQKFSFLQNSAETMQGGNVLPYTYEEADDNDAYPYTRPPLKRFQRLLIAIAGLLVLSFFINLLVYGKVDDAGVLAGKAIAQNDPPAPPPVKTNTDATVVFTPESTNEPIPAPPQETPQPATPATVDIPQTESTGQTAEKPAPSPSGLQCMIAGQELPQQVQELLTAGNAKATVFQLQAGGEALRGVLTAGGGDHIYKLQSEQREISVRIEQNGGILGSVTHAGGPAAVLLHSEQMRVLLLPRLRYSFGEMSTIPQLSDIQFNIKPTQIFLDSVAGTLLCNKFPIVNEGKPIHTSQKVSIILPDLRHRKPRISYNQDESLPVHIKLDPVSSKKGCCLVPLKLILANPFYEKIPSCFQEITRQSLSSTHGGCTCAVLFEIAENLAKRQLTEEELQAYNDWRMELLSLIPELPKIAHIHSDDNAYIAKQIKDNICTYINLSLSSRYRGEKERAESHRKPVELVLEDVRIQGKNEILWIFTLQEEERATDEP